MNDSDELVIPNLNFVPSPALTTSMKNLWAAIHLVVGELNSYKQENMKLAADYQTLKDLNPDYDPEYKNLREKIAILESHKLESENHIIRLDQKLSAREKEIEEYDTMEAQYYELKHENESLKQKISDSVNLEAQIEELKLEIELEKEASGNLESEKIEFLNRIKELEESERNFFIAQEEMVRKNHQLNSNVEEVNELKNRISELEIKLADFDKLSETLDSKEASLLDYMKQVNDLKSRNEEFVKILNERNTENDLLKGKESEINELNRKIAFFNQKLTDYENEITFTKNEILIKEKLAQDALNKNALFEKELNSFKSTLKEKDERLTGLLQFEAEFYRMQKEINGLKNTINDLNSVLAKINDEKLSLDNKVFSLIKENSVLTENVNSLNSTQNDLNNHLKSKGDMIASLSERNKKFLNAEELKKPEKQKLINDIESFIPKLEKMISK